MLQRYRTGHGWEGAVGELVLPVQRMGVKGQNGGEGKQERAAHSLVGEMAALTPEKILFLFFFFFVPKPLLSMLVNKFILI